MSAEVAAQPVAGQDELLDNEALNLIGELERRFGPRRRALLAAREEREERFAAGERPAFPEETRELREAEWTVAQAPPDLDDRRVEITGPAEAKMVINALNSGASVFMCCLEDALSPTWENVVAGQAAVRDATRRTLEFSSPEGKRYALGDTLATLVVRPRGWHMDERHVLVDGRPVSASLFDLGALPALGTAASPSHAAAGPTSTSPKLESRHEAELWNEVFVAAQEAVGLPRGTIRATVLIETITASFEMEEILFALREHSAGLNAGRWDYIFSAIKKFREDPAFVLPDRAAVTMAVPFMHAYTEQLVRACHRRGAHAIGGMAAFIPSRDTAVNEQAFARRPGGQGAGGEPGLRRHLGRASRARAAGARDLRRGARRPPQPEGPAARGRRARRGRTARAGSHTGRDHAAGRADERLGRPALPRRLARRPGSRGDRQPHGGRRHGRDLAGAALAMDPARAPHERGRARSPRSSTSASATRSWLACRPASTLTSPRPGACSTTSCWTRASLLSSRCGPASCCHSRHAGTGDAPPARLPAVRSPRVAPAGVDRDSRLGGALPDAPGGALAGVWSGVSDRRGARSAAIDAGRRARPAAPLAAAARPHAARPHRRGERRLARPARGPVGRAQLADERTPAARRRPDGLGVERDRVRALVLGARPRGAAPPRGRRRGTRRTSCSRR